MFSNEIRSIHAALGSLAGKISEQDWQLVKQARENLDALRVQLEEFEEASVASSEASA
ncbi:MAG: hypothetical protein DELT_02552 [Desulfovibrio sp.]